MFQKYEEIIEKGLIFMNYGYDKYGIFKIEVQIREWKEMCVVRNRKMFVE